jgi:hypothetical protein
MYKLNNGLLGQEVVNIKRFSDNAFIPLNPDNTDYQEYLKWLAEGNTPLPPDEPNGAE